MMTMFSKHISFNLIGAVVFSTLLVQSLISQNIMDYNGDGFDDLAIGIHGEDVGDLWRAGAVHVIFGRDNGLNSSGDIFYHQGHFWVDGTAEEEDNFGHVVVSGDFDGDGFGDLAIGIPEEDLGTGDDAIKNAGAVQVLYGDGFGPGSGGQQIWHQDVGGVRGQAGEQDLFGSALAAGDFNRDGYDDLAIGVPWEDVRLVDDNAGAINVLYGSEIGLTASGDQYLYQGLSEVTGVPENGDRFGSSLAVGDFDKNGATDLAIGVPYEDVGSIADAGAVNVLYGDGFGLGSGGDEIWHQGTNSNGDVIIGTTEAEDYFGISLVAGDFDGDGGDDLVVGVSHEGYYVGNQYYEDGGAVNVIYGSNTGLTGVGDELWYPGSNDLDPPLNTHARFGLAITTGDFDGDGVSDLVVGAPYMQLSDYYGAGGVYAIYGIAGYGLSSTQNQVWHRSMPGVEYGVFSNEYFGGSLGAGDFDKDGRDDLAVGVPGTILFGIDEGTVQVFYGVNVYGLQAGNDQVWHQHSPGMRDDAEPEDWFGTSLGGNSGASSIFYNFIPEGESIETVQTIGEEVKRLQPVIVLEDDEVGVDYAEFADNNGLRQPPVMAADRLESVSISEQLPQKTALYTNYPNPFNPETTISYQLSTPSVVTLAIYDVQGKRVKQLAVGVSQLAGKHSMVWDGTNDAGAAVASGVYLYRLKVVGEVATDNFYTATQKMLLAR